jgi:hypothetical protein
VVRVGGLFNLRQQVRVPVVPLPIVVTKAFAEIVQHPAGEPAHSALVVLKDGAADVYGRRIFCLHKLDVGAINLGTTKAVAGFEVVCSWSLAAAWRAEDLR